MKVKYLYNKKYCYRLRLNFLNLLLTETVRISERLDK